METIARLATPNFAVAREKVTSVRQVDGYYIIKVKKVTDSPLIGRAFFLKSGWFTYPDFLYVGKIVGSEQIDRNQMRLRVKKTNEKEEAYA